MSQFDTPPAVLAVGCRLASVASVAPKCWRALLAAALVTVIGATLWLPSPTLAAPDSCPFSGGGAPYAFQSWEADRDRSLYLDAQRLAAHNELFPGRRGVRATDADGRNRQRAPRGPARRDSRPAALCHRLG